VNSIGKTLIALLLLPGVTARAALVDVGNGLINHPAADMTWTADSNLFLTQVTADPGIVAQIIAIWHNPMSFPYQLTAQDFNTTDGTMTWMGAQAWIDWLNLNHYKGYVDWRLADVGPAGSSPGLCRGACYPSSGYAITSSEWFQLFYTELGGVEGVSIATTHNSSYALFTSLSGAIFWSGNGGGDLYINYFIDGWQGRNYVTLNARPWAVRTGQSVANPPPAAHLVLSTADLTFADQLTGTTGPSQGVTILNSGTGAATMAVSTSGDFTVTHNCPAQLDPGATCSAQVSFAPSTVDTRTGTLNVDAAHTRSVALTGLGTMDTTLTASVSHAVATEPVTLTWTSTPAGAQCTASGDWQGSLAANGTMVVTENVAHGATYGLLCTLGMQGDFASLDVSYAAPSVTLDVSSTNLTLGQSTTLTWTSWSSATCSASSTGASALWNGAKPVSGSAAIAETTKGLITYTLVCVSGAQTAQDSIQVFFDEAPKKKGGGGAFDWLSLLALLGCGALRVATPMRRAPIRDDLQ
jgi:hypothetical protein